MADDGQGVGALTVRVAIVVPYYQVDRGILAKAVRSVLSQDLPVGTAWHLIVVDDASPWPAEAELADLRPALGDRITILEQENAGPGGARNRALDWIAAAGEDGQAAFDLVAFLDSDDAWVPGHLAEAIGLIGRGHDLCFCNHVRFDDLRTYFEQVPAIMQVFHPEGGMPAAPGVEMIDTDGPVYEMTPEALMTAQLRAYVSQTSTVVVRADRVRRHRFDPELREAGEDHLFWIALAADAPRTAVSWRANVKCGRGVNVYFAALDWGSPRVVDRVGQVLLFHRKAARGFRLSSGDRGILRERIRHYERGYSFLFVRALLRGQTPSLPLFRRLARMSPGLVLWMPGRFLRILGDRRAESRFW